MKKLAILVLVLLSAQLFAQVPMGTLKVDSVYASHEGSPTFVDAFTNIKTDVGLYLLNELSHEKYNANMETMVKIEEEVDDLIKDYEKDLAELRASYADLIEKCQNQTEGTVGVMEDIKNKLADMENNMSKTQEDIHKANQKLLDAQKKLKKERKKSMWTKILYGAGGVGVGVILGVLVGG